MTVTLISGANRGLGYETARRLIGLGPTVLAGARDRQRGTKAARELGAAFLHIDPTDDASVDAAAARVPGSVQDLRWRLFGTRSPSGGRATRTWI